MMSLRAYIWGCLTTLAAATLASPAWAGGGITVLNVASAGGYQFTNFDGPTPHSQFRSRRRRSGR